MTTTPTRPTSTIHRAATVAALLAALALSACDGGAPEQTTPAPERRPASAATASATAVAPERSPAPTPAGPDTARAPDLDAVELRLEPVVDLAAPIALTARPGDDALYVAERAGRVVRVADGRVDGAVVDIGDETTTDGERGLLGLAFSPDGDELYLSSTGPDGASRLDAYPMAGGSADRADRRRLLEVAQPFSNHNGGHVVTGPDGLLYLGLGDGGAAGDPQGNGQDPTTLLGALLRIDPRSSGDAASSVPDGNPFVGSDAGADEVFVYGLRNPWRFSFDRETADLWIGDVGQNAVEEVTALSPADAVGANLGWNVFEGSRQFAGGQAPDAVPPTFEYPRDGGRCSVIGGHVYRGSAVTDLAGAYVYGDLCDGVVRAVVVEDGTVTDERAFDLRVPSLVSFGEDARGELYALSLDGTVFRLAPG